MLPFHPYLNLLLKEEGTFEIVPYWVIRLRYGLRITFQESASRS